MIDFYASREHYADHLFPIWHAVSPSKRGTFFIQPLNSLVQHVLSHGVGTYDTRPPPHGTDRLVVVAAAIDLSGLRRAVLVEHGAGQTYVDVDHEAWSGGPSRDRVELFVVPNEYAKAANRKRYPYTPQVVCAPHVEALRSIDRDVKFRVGFGRHWDSNLTPELASAWPYFFETIRAYCVWHRRDVALHFHPRVADVGRALAAEWDVAYLDTFDDVVRSCERWTVDNSSTGFEWAALDRPVVWLNAPHYRRGLEQGLRFWSHVDVGRQCDDAGMLEPALDAPYRPRPDLVADVYPVIDGSARLAAEAIEAL